MRDRGERPSQLPERDWDQVRQDWNDRRDEIRNDWQDHRDDIREDWQDWHDDHYPGYGGWYWGYAPGFWGAWDYLWDEYPVASALGLTWWGVNSMGYTYGCDDYYNPYYEDTGAISYAEPVVTASAAPSEAPPENLDTFDQARAAFYDGKYDDALKRVDEAAVKLPHDAVLHEFRSLVLFALGRYSESAAAIHAVLAVGPGWDWKTLVGLYPNVETYTTQLRALEAHCKATPIAADAQFLLGYHYLTCGHSEQALAAFRRANESQPKDMVSASLIRSLSPRDQASTPAPSERPAGEAPKPIPADDVVGSWTASGKGSATYAMTLTKEGTFTWGFARGAREEEVKGVYALEGNVLAMEPDSGGVMLAELAVPSADSLHFKMVGAQKNDPGLDFNRKKE